MQFTSTLFSRHSIGVIAALSAKVAGAGFAFFFSIMLARLLGPEGSGVYFLALTIVGIGVAIARLGLDNAVLRFASVAHNQGDQSTLAALYRLSIGLVIIAGTCIFLAFWYAVPYLPLGGEQADQLRVVLRLMLLALIPLALVMIHGEFLKAVGAPGNATFVQAVALSLCLVMGLVWLYWRGEATIEDVALIYVIAALASLLFAVFILFRNMPKLWREHGQFDIKLLLRTSLPLLWVASMNIVMSWTDILILGAWTEPAIVGVYGVATRIAALTSFILVAVNTVTAPRFAVLHAQGNHKALERLAQRSAGWMLLAAAPVILVLLLFPEWILQLFGADFVEGALLLRILVLGQLVNVSIGSVGYLLIMTGHERLMRNSIMLSAFLNLVGNFALVPAFGGIGAAVSTAFSLAFMNTIFFVIVYKKLKVNTLGYLVRWMGLCVNRQYS